VAAGVAFFAVKSIGLSTVNGRKPCTLSQAVSHNLREIQAERGAVERIDVTRTNRNTILDGPGTAADVLVQANEALQCVDTSKLKRDHCQAIEAVFSLPEQSRIEPFQYFADCLAWAKSTMGIPVTSAVVHYDEGAPHMHILMLPIQNGKHVGGKPIARPEVKRLRESFFLAVAGLYGLKRDTAKVRGMVKKWAVDAVLRKCNVSGFPNAIGPLWRVLQAAIERDPTDALNALGIDVNTIRPVDDAPESPIGLHPTPMGLEKAVEKTKPYLCVGLGVQATSLSHQATPTHQPSISHLTAQQFQQSAVTSHQKPPTEVGTNPGNAPSGLRKPPPCAGHADRFHWLTQDQIGFIQSLTNQSRALAH